MEFCQPPRKDAAEDATRARSGSLYVRKLDAIFFRKQQKKKKKLQSRKTNGNFPRKLIVKTLPFQTFRRVFYFLPSRRSSEIATRFSRTRKRASHIVPLLGETSISFCSQWQSCAHNAFPILLLVVPLPRVFPFLPEVPH